MQKPLSVALLGFIISGTAPLALAAGLDTSIAVIRAVEAEGKGNVEASAAWKNLAAAQARELPTLLAGMDGANDLALNWLRAAVDTIVARTAANHETLPVFDLEQFVRAQNHHPRARRLAYELIASADPKIAERLMTGMLDDPSPELRREAVQQLLVEAEGLNQAGKTNESVARYQAALNHAREVDQIDSIAAALRKLGAAADLQKVFGWVNKWQIIGPFDNSGGVGYERVFPPESAVDLNGQYEGKSGKVHWQEVTATGDYGTVDFNKPIGSLKEVTGYAWTEFYSDRPRPVELRLACKNGWKVWLNGNFLSGRNEYHLNTQLDHFKLAGNLEPGRNTILVKLCQNAETAGWAKQWEFQMRVTDSIGTPVFSMKK